MTITREQAADLADAHDQHHVLPDGLPREGCPECEGRELSSYPRSFNVAVIDVEGGFSIAAVNPTETSKRLYELIDCRTFTMFSIAGLDFWCDDEGMYNHSRNPGLTRLVASYAPLRQYLYGACVIARSNDEGDMVGLSDDDLADIARRHVLLVAE